jgi:hypothetical protein
MLHIPLRGLKKKELSMFQESKGVTQIEIRKKYRAETSAALNELSEYLSRPHRKNLGVEGRGRYNNDNKKKRFHSTFLFKSVSICFCLLIHQLPLQFHLY